MLRTSLSRKIVLPLGAVVLLLQIGLAAYALDHERKALLNGLDTRAARLGQIRHAFDLRSEEFDEPKVAKWLGTTLLEQQDVLFCEVVDAEGRTLFRQGTPDEPRSRRYAFPVTRAAQSSSIAEAATGTLYLALSTVAIDEPLTTARTTLAVAILAGTALVVTIANLLVRYTIGNTVTKLLRTAQDASTHRPERPSASGSDVELEPLAEMLNGLTDQLHDVVEREKRLTAEMISEQSQREEAVK